MVRREGFWWPDHEEASWQQTLEDIHDLDKALGYVKNRSVCVQAGGNVGVWALHLAMTFQSVITFEPDEDNWDCLMRNVEDRVNELKGIVYPIWGAIGDVQGKTGLSRQIGNCGSFFVHGDGDIPIYCIDSVPLSSCDFLVLDLEGMEPKALAGASETIARFRPVIMVEDKWNSERYGVERGWSAKLPGYRVAEYVGRHKDPILVPDDA